MLCSCPTEVHYEDCRTIRDWGEHEALRTEIDRLRAELELEEEFRATAGYAAARRAFLERKLGRSKCRYV